MKTLIAAVSFAAFAAPAFADAGLPYYQNSIDTALPNVTAKATDRAPRHAFAPPYEQLRVDRALPSIDNQRLASAGATATHGGSSSVSLWTSDYNFIAPAR